MKKIVVLLLVVVGLVLVINTVAATADGGAATDVVEFCKMVKESYPDFILGDCVSAFRTATWDAKYCQEYYYLAGFENAGQCVKAFKPPA